MSSDVAANERLVVSVLAEQMAALAEQIAGSGMVGPLVACGDLLSVLVSQIDEHSPAAATAAQLDKALDDLAFRQAQQQDLGRQTADLVMRALRMLSSDALSLECLKALYVSDQQRRLHEQLVATTGHGA